ncbi:hypothetical protein P0082_08880 [Candidatus Haliotispira prima]|uniref:Uncharacterized protein n=1 Tax=Candidatus Haliotispira prima TaxID=3034016 RepID=A0ABY8MFF4_9SPIO|nr:hypothetical protein P0082_08880 [Candidatus Haliotispira prima]
MKKYIFALLGLNVILTTVPIWAQDRSDDASKDQESVSNSRIFYLADGKELVIDLPVVETLQGEGKETMITLEPGQRIDLKMKERLGNRKFPGLTLLPSEELTGVKKAPSDLLVYFSQDYDSANNVYSQALVLMNFRSKGLILKCQLETYRAETQKWQKIGTLKLKGDGASDQFQFRAILARIRLSKFRLAGYRTKERAKD